MQLANTRKTVIFEELDSFPLTSIHCGSLSFNRGENHSIIVSFFGPSSGSLVLRLTHYSEDEAERSNLQITLEGSEVSLTTTTWSVVDVPLNRIPGITNGLCYKPDHRNDLIITHASSTPFDSYMLQDLKLLLDEEIYMSDVSV